MNEWRYTPDDFVLFSARTYERLVEHYNQQWWPLHGLAVVAGLAAVVLLQRRRNAVAAGVLATAWMWVGWAFLLQRYASIQWAAPIIATAFALQAVMVWLRAPRLARPSWAATALALAVLIGYPLLAPLSSRPWGQAEVFGMTPDPTALVTLALQPRGAPWLLPIPLLWCAYSSATLWVLRSPHWWLPATGAVLAVAISVLPRRRAAP